MNKKQITKIFAEGVRDGHLKCDVGGRYSMADAGKTALAVHALIETFNVDRTHAYTFGALVTMTAVAPEIVAAGLAELIRDGGIEYGFLDEKNPNRHIFYRCDRLSPLRLFSAKDESAEEDKYLKHVKQVLIHAIDAL